MVRGGAALLGVTLHVAAIGESDKIERGTFPSAGASRLEVWPKRIIAHTCPYRKSYPAGE
jgi:hypothetical protein